MNTTNKSLLQIKKERQNMFLVKNRNGNYELLNELQNEKRLIYGY